LYEAYNKSASQSKPTTNGSSLPWLPNAKLVAMVDCGLTGPIPSFMLNLPKATAIVLSGNQLSGPIPTAAPNSPARHQLTQLVAAEDLVDHQGLTLTDHKLKLETAKEAHELWLSEDRALERQVTMPYYAILVPLIRC
jgi:hypothetical protein